MELTGIWVLFSYFDTQIGPVTYMVKPLLKQSLQKRINKLMDIDIDNSKFEYSFQEIKTFNHMFYIESPDSRGRTLLCMLSICLEKETKKKEEIYQKLEKYVGIIKRIPKLYLLLTTKNLEKEELDAMQTNFTTLISNLYDEIKHIPEIGIKVVPMIIPGFFRYKEDTLINTYQNWISFENEIDLFKDLLDYIIRSQFDSAYSSWKEFDEGLIKNEENKIKFFLIGSFLSLKLEEFESAYQLAESALELSKKSEFYELYLDAILLLIECGSHLGIIMIFETALTIFDGSCGLSSFILRNYSKFFTLLEEGLELLEQCDTSRPDIKIRRAIFLMFLGKLKFLIFKTGKELSVVEEAINLLDESYKNLKSSPFTTILIQNRVILSLAYEILQNYQKSTKLLENAFDLTPQIPTNLKQYYIAWILQRQGWNYLHNGFIKETTEKFQHSLFEIQKINNVRDREILLAKTYMRMCYILSFQQVGFKKILTYYETSEKILKKYNEGIELSRLYYVMGDIFKSRGELTKALNYYKRCEELARSIDDKESIGISLTRKARISVQKLHLDQALELYQEALSYFEDINHLQFLGITYGEIGAIYQALGNKQVALKNYKLGLESFGNEGNILESYWILYKLVYLLLNTNFDQARKYANRLLKLRKKTNSDIIYQVSRLVKALILTYNPNPRQRMKSIFLLEQVVEEKIIQHHLSHAALMHLCDLLLKETLTTYDEQNIKDLKKYLNNLASISQEFHLSHELIEIKILSSKIALIQNDIKRASKLIEETKKISQNLNNPRINTKIRKATTRIEDYKKEMENIDFKNLSLKDRLIRVNFEEEMKNFIRLYNI
jgi:tetratricopeptide (TPR) repeat protein